MENGVLVLVRGRRGVLLKAFLTVLSYRSGPAWIKALVPADLPILKFSSRLIDLSFWTLGLWVFFFILSPGSIGAYSHVSGGTH